MEFPSEQNHRRQRLRSARVGEKLYNVSCFNVFPFSRMQTHMEQCTLAFSTETPAETVNTDWAAGKERSPRSCASEQRRRLELWELSGPPPSAGFAHGLDGSNHGQLGSHDSPALSAHYHWSS